MVNRRECVVAAVLLCGIPVVHAQVQDPPAIARALERAERFDAATGPRPQPTAKWVGPDRLAYSPTGSAPWSIFEPATGRVLESDQSDAKVGGPGPAATPPLGLAYFGAGGVPSTNAGEWTTQAANGGLTVLDATGATRLALAGAQNYGWGLAPLAWSRDARYFGAVRTDTREMHRIPIVDYTSAVERVSYAPYAKTGTPVPVTELHMVDPAAGVARPAQLETRDASIWFLGWRRATSEAVVMRLSRTGKRLDLFAIEGATGAARLLAVDERPETFVGALDFTTSDWPLQVTPLPDESGFLWMSERDGWRHVYHYGFDGKLKNRVTTGAFPVHRVAHIDLARKQIYVVASADPTRPYDRHVYRVGLDGTGFTAVTSAPGQHDPAFSSSGDYFVDAYSNLKEPHTVELRRSNGTVVSRLGQASTAHLTAVGYIPPEPFRVKASDGITDLYGVLYKPADFDANRRYPIIDYIYAGPFLAVHQTTYTPATSMHRISAALAQMGFVVAMLDARGTPGRGKAFQDANYGRIGQDVEIPDHVAALRELAKTRPYIDTARAGIAGHSWGGYFALRGMLTAPDFFKVGYAGAPGDLTEAASINEPNMGLITDNQAGYTAGSNPGRASDLRGRLKIMHGTSDVMAPLSTTMRMAQALIEANRTFDLLIMPGQPHGPSGAAGRYYREDVRRFMATHLLTSTAGTPAR